MQLERQPSMCPVCGSYLNGGHPLGWGRQVRCLSCQSSAPAEPPRRPLLAALRRRLRRARHRPRS